ncbi:hypothetical protein [Hymenobacter sp.]|uniref:hypothetical protein n=1 Tax=Hymenobacter sp. TaxID=1898978 RepID=UPI002EDB7886
MPESVALLATVQGRQRLVMTALNLTRDTALAPIPSELHLLEQFVRGNLTLDQIVACLEEAPEYALTAVLEH